MRKCIEKFARELHADESIRGETTMGEIAERYGESVDRVFDALEMMKVLELTGAIASEPLTYISV